LYLPEITFDHMLDGIYATKACKTSIKAWHKLSMDQMINLIKEWFDNIEWMFVCQHGRPSFVKIDKKKIDELFDR
jgi:DNA mismatch repair ATPase MutL